MDTFTNDERREVAEKLRHASHTDANLDVTIAIAILDTIGEVHRPIAAVVADLIDPTCHVVGTTSEEGLYDGLTIFRHELSCGHTCETVWLEPPAYCDECGARVVRDDE